MTPDGESDARNAAAPREVILFVMKHPRSARQPLNPHGPPRPRRPVTLADGSGTISKMRDTSGPQEGLKYPA